MKKIVVLDAGHGGHDSGAVGPNGLREKDVALAIVRSMREILVLMDVEVVLTREGDTFLELSARADVANRRKADAFLSVHCNSADNAAASGFEVFTTPGATRSDEWATLAFLDCAAEFPNLKKRIDTADGDVDKEAGFTVLMKADCPAILFETEFISNAAGESFLKDPGNQARIAASLCRSLLVFLGGKAGTVVSPPPAADDKAARILAHAKAIIDLAS